MPRPLLALAITLLLSARAHAQQPLSQLAAPGTEAIVLFFVASDCPISNRTFPEMRRLREQFANQHIVFAYLYPNAQETRPAIEQHQHDFDPEGAIAADPTGELLRLTKARVTPEVAILTGSPQHWTPAYVGRIDDRFVHIGQERPAATRHFAEEALLDLLAGKPVPPATGTPVGCTILTREAR